MRWKRLFWVLIAVFSVVLVFRLKKSYSNPRSTGFLVRTGDFDPSENCEFRTPLVLHVSGKDTLRLNAESVAKDKLSARLDMILKGRVRPVLYVEANSEITVQEFVQILDLVMKTNEKIEVRLVTPKNRQQSCVDFRPGPAT